MRRFGAVVAPCFCGLAAVLRWLLVTDPPRYDSVVAVGSRGAACASPRFRVRLFERTVGIASLGWPAFFAAPQRSCYPFLRACDCALRAPGLGPATVRLSRCGWVVGRRIFFPQLRVIYFFERVVGEGLCRAHIGHPPPWGSGFTTGVLQWTWHSGMPQRRWIKPVRPRASRGKMDRRGVHNVPAKGCVDSDMHRGAGLAYSNQIRRCLFWMASTMWPALVWAEEKAPDC